LISSKAEFEAWKRRQDRKPQIEIKEFDRVFYVNDQDADFITMSQKCTGEYSAVCVGQYGEICTFCDRRILDYKEIKN
jgi:hypothetical protein